MVMGAANNTRFHDIDVGGIFNGNIREVRTNSVKQFCFGLIMVELYLPSYYNTTVPSDDVDVVLWCFCRLSSLRGRRFIRW